MNRMVLIVILLVCIIFPSYHLFAADSNKPQAWIRINQQGYLPQSVKVAVFATKAETDIQEFYLKNAASTETVFKSKKVIRKGKYGPFNLTFRLDFSNFVKTGNYFIEANGVKSPHFTIGNSVYHGTADFLLKYMRQQRCGFNPFLKDSCHTKDGYTVYGPMPDGTRIDVRGGWHDAADYLQYVATSANATFNLLFAWRDFPDSFSDNFLGNGLEGANGTADVLDEAHWGLEWLLKMYPQDDRMFNQIADDRDHIGFHLPTQDSIQYGEWEGRPVYFCSGEVQGLMQYKNRATGVASTAGKYVSAFALGAQVYKNINSDFAEILSKKAVSAYQLGLDKPGACHTAPCRAPYFYEEDNWVDDMELGAAQLYALSKSDDYLRQAFDFAQKEKITPWMGADTARHYQWYPFLNIGHYELAKYAPDDIKQKVIDYYREGIEKVWQKGKDNGFLMGVPFIWCSNNLVAAFVTQCFLYRQLSGDKKYIELESAMRDWLFGCNPWGTSMIIGLPENGIYPKDPHSAFTHLYNYPIDGGLIDGPVYGSIYKNLKYVHLKQEDEFAGFQSDLVVYHDDVGDYSTNEPTMDGTATLVYYLAAMEAQGKKQDHFERSHGAIIRGDKSKKEIALVFTGDEFADGADVIRKTLAKDKINASFFFTGNFYRNEKFNKIITSLKKQGHYLGAHSDKHLLYCSWENRDSLLVDKKTFLMDLENNYREMEKFEIQKDNAQFFLPPFEWYNKTISNWTTEAGFTLINFTPGTRSNADYTTPQMGSRYVSNKEIFQSILRHEKENTDGLNGFILLLHIGTAPERQEKFFNELEELVSVLLNAGYVFKKIDDLLEK